MPYDMTHLCENCRTRTELFYVRSVDQFLCEDCVMILAATTPPEAPDDADAD